MNLLPVPVVPDQTVNRAFDAVEVALVALAKTALVDAVVLAPVTIGTTDTRVCHGLGRSPVGYLLVRSPSDVRVFDGLVPETKDPTHYISLRLSTAAKVTLVVF